MWSPVSGAQTRIAAMGGIGAQTSQVQIQKQSHLMIFPGAGKAARTLLKSFLVTPFGV